MLLFKGPINIFKSARKINVGAWIKNKAAPAGQLVPRQWYSSYREAIIMFYHHYLADSFIQSTLQERNTLRSHLGLDTLTCCF